ncbi:hypothetical protein [Virgisporangium aurantiacum]|uniref:hypothetical protein n=1 Tax=Virgisporangium aurantiacum TaxID=175570 RepID=UPI00194F9302|nr:hypothetical protein [Virgisporangium aurantiacum]
MIVVIFLWDSGRVKRLQPVTMQLYCRLEVVVHDPEAVTSLAAQQLREANIDWSEEEDNVETAVDELKADLCQSLAGVMDPLRLVDGVPGVEARGGLIWAEIGEAHRRFRAGDGDGAAQRIALLGDLFEELRVVQGGVGQPPGAADPVRRRRC